MRLEGNRKLILIPLFFLALKLFTWGFGYYLSSSGYIHFDAQNYMTNFRHIELDNRALSGGKRDFFNLWKHADSEWYLSIAKNWYPTPNQIEEDLAKNFGYKSTEQESIKKYVFFPLFPVIIKIFMAVFPLEAAAFTANLLINTGMVCVFMLFMKKYFPRHEGGALWPFLLISLFPFSIFYSLYFPESLFLLLSMLVFLFMRSQRYLLMAVSGFLLSLTRPNGMFIVLPVLFHLAATRRRESNCPEGKKGLAPFFYALIIPMGFVAYLFYIYLRTGSWDFYYQVNKFGWGIDFSMVEENLAAKLYFFRNFPSLPLHSFSRSKLDVLVFLLFGVIISLMWLNKKFPKELTLWSTFIWLVPLVSKPGFLAFSRYMSVSFPVFIFIGLYMRRTRYLILPVFALGYFLALKAVLEYRWVG